MNDDLTEILSDPPPPNARKGGCHFGKWLHTLEQEKQEAIRTALADDRWEHQALGRTLSAEAGMQVSIDTMTRHRKSECKCDAVGLR